MPFIGQDWRSPGEVWIKTIEGWEPMKLLRKSHFVRHQNDRILCDANGLSSSSTPSSSPNDYVTHCEVVVLPSSSSSSLSSSLDGSSSGSSCAGSSTDSDSDGELVIQTKLSENIVGSNPVPILSHKTRHLSDINSRKADLSPPYSCSLGNSIDGSSLTVAEIIQRLQRSSSQPIPIDILKESSEQIEIYHTQPYYRITLNPTREVQGSNIISDAFYKLDFCNAIRDIRRFAYVSKLLHLLITQNLTSLSGNATKALFWMLEEIAKQVASNKQNIHVIRGLLIELREIVDKYLCWGRPLGSTSLWEQHLRTMERICEMTDAIEIVPPEQNGKPSWLELPEELIREILLRLSDYKDLKSSAQACQRMNWLLNEEQHIWKQLVKYHFTKEQLNWALKMSKENSTANLSKSKIKNNDKNYEDDDDDSFNSNKTLLDWEEIFHFLRKKFGLKEEYADCLFLCRYCRCLFWKSKNHPCILENPDLTRQVLVTSPLTGFTSTTSKPPTKFLGNLLQKNRKKFLSGQSPVSGTSSAPEASSSTLSHSSHILSTTSNNNLINNRSPSRPLPGGPVIVQNMPFFEHPLVIQRLNNNSSSTTASSSFQKTPLHVPITPQAFLKFFSL